ncbi:ABC transporter permease [Tumebacillus sp. BK434]|uniref:ABC transporter permease n=1 Tax=Tumebacillus sp. BK434 TaxID=2512169 RepID=UPI001048CFD3|nr:ABC transporter permease [Tumebacillus sp. BK434]
MKATAMGAAPMPQSILKSEGIPLWKRKVSELATLCWMQLLQLRENWVWVVLLASMFPMTTLLFMKFLNPNPTPAYIVQTIAGNMIFGVIVSGVNMMSQSISWQKEQGHFTYYLSLPLHKLSFVTAVLFRGLLNTVPSLVVMTLIGKLAFQVDFQYSWWLLPLFFLATYVCSAFGTVIGFWSKNQQLTNMISQVLMMFLSFLSPVMVTMEQLPGALQNIAYVFPTTYIAEAARTLLLTGYDATVGWQLLILSGYALVFTVLIIKKADWRAK